MGCSFVPAVASNPEAHTQFTGVNLASGEFGDPLHPGTVGVDYIYPTHAEIDYFVGKGLNAFRLPFMWERLQRAPYADLNAADMAVIDDLVTYATAKGAYVILDPHNAGRYTGKIIGVDLPNAIFADFWWRLSTRYATNPHVIFGLMNEPHDISAETWVGSSNAAIAAIRVTGAHNLILVPGTLWTSGQNWTLPFMGTSNAIALLAIADPVQNYAYEIHQYLDASTAGTSPDCVSPTIGVERINAFTQWLHLNNKRGFLGEFGGGRNDGCYQALENLLAHLDANRDVYLGWTYWAAGPRWNADYPFSIEPQHGVDQPQLRHLLAYAPYA